MLKAWSYEKIKNISKQKLLRTAKTALSIAALMVGLQSKLKMEKVD